VNLRFIDWIWQVRGSLPLAPAQSGHDAFDRLDPLFGQPGTSHERTIDRLIFTKKNQAAQDKMSIFDGGVLQIEKAAGGTVLRYRLTSRALLFCFLAPLLFLGIAQLTLFTATLEKPKSDAAKAAEAKKTAAAKEAPPPMNPIDKALGAPAPEKPGKKAADEARGRDKKPTATPAYVFAALFATLYVVGRILEDWLIRRLFRKRLQEQ
jgi:hypothetical protein